MNNAIVQNVIRWVAFVLIQVLVLKQIEINTSWFHYMSILFYPLFIILLPLRYSTINVMVIGFFTGLIVDVFYDSIGVHAASCVFLAFIRPFAFTILSPREGYSVDLSPTAHKLSFPWFVRFSGLLMLSFCFFYFSVEAFTFAYIGQILLKTGVSFIFSMILILAFMMIFNPKE